MNTGARIADFWLENRISAARYQIFRTRHLRTGKRYILKIASRNEQAIIDCARLEHEASILKDLKHPNIIGCDGIYSDLNVVALITEDTWGFTSLRHAIQNGLTAGNAIRTASRVANGLAYLHHLSISHRDVKSDNILIRTDSGTSEIIGVKLIDFGFAWSGLDNANNLFWLVGGNTWIYAKR